MPPQSFRRKIKDAARAVLPKRNAPHIAGGVSVFIMVALVLQLILFLLHFMIYEVIGAAFGVHGFIPALILGILSLTFISASLLAAAGNNMAIRIYYRISAIWFSLVPPLCGACAAFVAMMDLFPVFGWTIMPFMAGVISFGAAIAVSLYGIWNGARLQVRRVTVSLPNLPRAWRGKRLVFFSDVHLGDVYGKNFTKRIVQRVRLLDPTMVVIGGDLFDGMKCDARSLVMPFKDLHPARGIYFVSGNHEYIRDSELFFSAIRSVGIVILHNEKVNLDGMDLIGVDWSDTDKPDDFAAVLERLHLQKGQPNILLRHAPDNLHVAERAGISLQLSGHTHHGQFWPLSLATRYFYQGFDYGLHYFGRMALYTSSGIGTWMSPFRFGTKAEIVAIEFK